MHLRSATARCVLWAWAMAVVRSLFASRVYEASLAEADDFAAFNAELERACRMLADEDRAGQAWCREHGYGGHTPYSSLRGLPPPGPAVAQPERPGRGESGRVAQGPLRAPRAPRADNRQPW